MNDSMKLRTQILLRDIELVGLKAKLRVYQKQAQEIEARILHTLAERERISQMRQSLFEELVEIDPKAANENWGMPPTAWEQYEQSS